MAPHFFLDDLKRRMRLFALALLVVSQLLDRPLDLRAWLARRLLVSRDELAYFMGVEFGSVLFDVILDLVIAHRHILLHTPALPSGRADYSIPDCSAELPRVVSLHRRLDRRGIPEIIRADAKISEFADMRGA